jgi:hypothetical protein
MSRPARLLFAVVAALSLLLSVAVCVLWVRGRIGFDEIEWGYDRWLPDRSAANNQVHLSSDNRRLWLYVGCGHAPPFNGQLVYGYYLNADRSGGRPRLTFDHTTYGAEWRFYRRDPDAGTTGFGPLRWHVHGRSRPTDGDDYRSIRIGVSHWLAALILLVPPALWLNRFRHARHSRRARALGLCPACGYDLRATPQRCPECGTEPRGVR